MATSTATATTDPLLAELDAIGVELEVIEQRQSILYARRLVLWLEGRKRIPPLLNRELASAAHTTPGAVAQALRKERIDAKAPVL